MSTTDHLGNMDLVVADKYKYQGQIMNHKSDLADHLQMIKTHKKTEAANQRYNYRERKILWQWNGSHMENIISKLNTNSDIQWSSMENKKENKLI